MLVHILIVFFQTTSFVSEVIPVYLWQFFLHLAFVLLLSFQRERNVEETEACKVATATVERNSMLFLCPTKYPFCRLRVFFFFPVRRNRPVPPAGPSRPEDRQVPPAGLSRPETPFCAEAGRRRKKTSLCPLG